MKLSKRYTAPVYISCAIFLIYDDLFTFGLTVLPHLGRKFKLTCIFFVYLIKVIDSLWIL